MYSPESDPSLVVRSVSRDEVGPCLQYVSLPSRVPVLLEYASSREHPPSLHRRRVPSHLKVRVQGPCDRDQFDPEETRRRFVQDRDFFVTDRSSVPVPSPFGLSTTVPHPFVEGHTMGLGRPFSVPFWSGPSIEGYWES